MYGWVYDGYIATGLYIEGVRFANLQLGGHFLQCGKAVKLTIILKCRKNG